MWTQRTRRVLVLEHRSRSPASFSPCSSAECRGYLLNNSRRAHAKGANPQGTSFDNEQLSPKGYLLIAQGNAILADQILSSFAQFANAGLDVYIFDYRGYGRSGGKRWLKAIVSDYREIIESLNSLEYSAHRFYAMSFGASLFLTR